MLVLGIDPGITGGAVILSTGTGPPVVETAMRMPIYVESAKKLIDAGALFRRWSEWTIDVAVCEWVHSMPRQGVVSAFSFGRSTGAIEAVAQLCAKRVVWVSPRRWKKFHGLGADKKASTALAKEKFGHAWKWNMGVEDGIAEAALMALWWMDSSK